MQTSADTPIEPEASSIFRGGVRRRLRLLPPLAVAVFSLLVYLPVAVSPSFHMDDLPNVARNPLLESPSPARVAQFWRAPFAGLYTPLPYTVWAALVVCVGTPGAKAPLPAQPFHALNVVTHVLSALLVFAILRRLFPLARWAACAGAMLFAVHPIQVEAVAYVSEFRTLLAGGFSMLCLWLFLRWLAPSWASTDGRNVRILTLSVLAFGLALLSKPSALALPLFLLLFSTVIRRRPLRSRLLALSPFAVLAIAAAAVTIRLQTADALVYLPSLVQRPLVALHALGFYLGKLALPTGLVPDYGHEPSLVLARPTTFMLALAPLGLLVALWFVRRRAPSYWLAMLLFTAGILPVAGLLPFEFQRVSTTADRYLYLSMLGPALALAAFLANRSGPMARLLPTAYLALIGFLSFAQASEWRQPFDIFVRTLKVNPRSSLALRQLATSADHDPRRKIVLSLSAVIASPASSAALRDLADVLLDLQRNRPSFDFTEFAGNAERSRQYLMAGAASVEAGQFRHATMQYALAIVDDLLTPVGHNNLGGVLVAIGESDRALRHLELAEALLPGHPSVANNRAIAQFHLGQESLAVAEFERLAPREPAALHNFSATAAWRDSRSAPPPRFAYLYLPPPPKAEPPPEPTPPQTQGPTE